MVEPPQYVLGPVRKDEEFILYRGKPSNRAGSHSVLQLTPVSTRPGLETLKKIDHEYSLRDELDSVWAVRPLALPQQRGQTTLVLEDPGGEPLAQLPPGPMEVTQFLRFAIGLATALGGLHALAARLLKVMADGCGPRPILPTAPCFPSRCPYPP